MDRLRDRLRDWLRDWPPGRLRDRLPGPAADPRLTRPLASAAALSLLAWALLVLVAPRPAIPWSAEMRDAAVRMEAAVAALGREVADRGLGVGVELDPNRTGLVGPADGELFTTLGHLEAKRTTTVPDLAGLLVHLLQRAGVEPGDVIAIGASGSFPALLLATAAAAAALDAQPVVILSLGASSYGATRAELDLLHYHDMLHALGLFAAAPAAVSLGGAGDVGADLEPAIRARLLDRVRESGAPLVHEPDLERNVARRMTLYTGTPPGHEGPGRVAAFVNIGGNTANIGASPLVLNVPAGLVDDVALPPPHQRGVIHQMAREDTPVLHLLHVRGLAARHGLAWDPVPLPPAGSTRLRDHAGDRSAPFLLLAIAYFAALGGLALRARGRKPA
jgi:poly-gamma-glutamate system protein